MYALVKYVDDGIYYICSTKHMYKRSGAMAYVKYEDGYKYRAIILGMNECMETLQDIKRNLMQGCPIIELTRLDTIDVEVEDSISSYSGDNCNDDDSDMDPDFNIDNLNGKRKFIGPWTGTADDTDASDASSNDITNEGITCHIDYEREKETFTFANHSSAVGNSAVQRSMNGNTDIDENRNPLDEGESEIGSTSERMPHLKKNEATLTNRKREKKNHCMFCKKLITHLPRHLESIHVDDDRVKEFTVLPRGCPKRKLLIDKLRKEGNFLAIKNKNSSIIVPLRTCASSRYEPCPSCHGFYAKNSLRKHYVKCSGVAVKGEKILFQLTRKLKSQCHTIANAIVKNEIFPVLRECTITDIVKFDELCCIYANKMTVKYRKKHHQKMIRSRLRLIGRILVELKGIDSTITDFASIFCPKHFDSVILAVNKVAGLDEAKEKYRSPATAFSCGTLLKKCANILITEFIKRNNGKGKDEVENFQKLLCEDFGTAVNKTVEENQLEQKRLKKTVLPDLEDIKALNDYLKKTRRTYFDLLSQKYSYTYYKKLLSVTLISVQIFNRRRAGEIERIELQDYKNCESINEGHFPDYFKSLSAEGKNAASNYVRFTIRGKLGRQVPVILYKELVACLNLLLKNRDKAGIPKDNPYVFGIPSKFNSHITLQACSLMREYSVECGAKNPHSLRGTHLRKHIATSSALYNLNELQIKDLANFMGHSQSIHENHYRLPIAAREITTISKLLEMAQGEEPDDDFEVNLNSTNSITDEEDDDTHRPNRRSTSPYGHCKRTSWTDIEKTKMMELFSGHLEAGRSPGLQECQDARIRCPELSSRTATQMKLFIHNRLPKKTGMTPRRSIIPWEVEEKNILKSVFKKHLLSGSLPSLQECTEVYNKYYDILSKRTPVTIKAWVAAEINRSKNK